MSSERRTTPDIEAGARLGRKKEISMPVDRCLFVDLDMTLIDESYQITDSGVFARFEEAQKKGWRIGLNSNTPLEPLLVWMRYFHLQGPVVAEKGTVVYDNGDIIFDDDVAIRMRLFRNGIEERLVATKTQWLSGNPVDVIRENKFHNLKPGPLILLNTVRKCSLEFYMREITPDGNVIVNANLIEAMISELRQDYDDNLSQEINRQRGSFLVMQKGQSKRTGVQAFMDREGLKQVGIIGDSMNDFLGYDVAVHYAVGNAKQDFKEKAVFVSNFPMTRGCSDILNRLTTK